MPCGRWKVFASIAAISLLLPAKAFSLQGDGQTTMSVFHGICDPYLKYPSNPEVGSPCVFYMQGLTDAFLLYEDYGKRFCPPREARLPTLINAVFDYLRSYPQKNDTQAPIVILIALSKAYPCPK